MAIVFKDNIEVPDIEVGGLALGLNAFTSTTIPTNNNQISNGAGYVTSSGNTTIGITQSNTLNTATVFATLNFTDGVATSATTRTLTLGNLGFTGANNANYITNNNQLTNGAGYTTNTGTVTGVTATSPVVSSGGAAPIISMPAATSSTNGYLTSTNWQTFNNKTSNTGTITNVIAGTGMTGGGSSGSVTLNNSITNNNQLTNGAGYITASGVSSGDKGSFHPTATQTISSGGTVLTRSTLLLPGNTITAVGMSMNAAGDELTLSDSQDVEINLNFASIASSSTNRILTAAVVQIDTGSGEWVDIQGTEVYNYDRGVSNSNTSYGYIIAGSGGSTVFENIRNDTSKLRVQFWIVGRASTGTGMTTLSSGCRLSVKGI
tara:strand:+ start:289 stop:1419 length:1131 start_codon:yes stop_codon:yes gene_type:complete